MSHTTPPAPVSLGQAFWYWLKLGFISFGGPTGQIAIMHQDLVEKKRWISEKRFLHALNYCMVLPGPEAQQLATYIGWLMHRTWGGILAGGLFVLPSLFILIALTWVYLAFGDLPLVAGILYGIKPAVTAIVLLAAWRIGSRETLEAGCGADAEHGLTYSLGQDIGSTASIGAQGPWLDDGFWLSHVESGPRESGAALVSDRVAFYALPAAAA